VLSKIKNFTIKLEVITLYSQNFYGRPTYMDFRRKTRFGSVPMACAKKKLFETTIWVGEFFFGAKIKSLVLQKIQVSLDFFLLLFLCQDKKK